MKLTFEKPNAKYYIDDHGYGFEKGNVNSWKKVVEMLRGELR